ncbi:TetR/AcrR family transcriptional regulator [Blastococcus saxobsidens]|uniref:TetR family transcriptional regulator n=1 Tax=Blastococcus saxobsidens TaxID=138336 RepID=A0A4V2G2N3_9ACTN|nr:TetR/AcrR family transcriptional regulator [Blastococcus saxobsidens]RZU33856.1 TetR family transcriptional regulator [Blastococcus saxobsidens]
MTDGPEGRTRRWETTHRRILAAALALFQEHGFDEVGVAHIAAAAHVSVPTFYAHYPSKEHVIMQLPTREATAALLAAQPADLPLGQQIRRGVVQMVAQFTPEDRAELSARWRVIATTPALRNRAAEFERTTATMLLDNLTETGRRTSGPTDAVVAGAYMSAFTVGLLAWADGDFERKLEECLEEAFDALEAA